MQVLPEEPSSHSLNSERLVTLKPFTHQEADFANDPNDQQFLCMGTHYEQQFEEGLQRKLFAENIDALEFDVQIKTIVSRIKNCTAQIREKVRTQKELSESFIQSVHDATVDNSYLNIGEVDEGLEVSVILNQKLNDKSGFIAGDDNSYLMNQATGQFANIGDSSFLMSPHSEKEEKIKFDDCDASALID